MCVTDSGINGDLEDVRSDSSEGVQAPPAAADLSHEDSLDSDRDGALNLAPQREATAREGTPSPAARHPPVTAPGGRTAPPSPAGVQAALAAIQAGQMSLTQVR